MEPTENGEALPTINVAWDEKNQTAIVRFDSQQFKQWDFVIAVLNMGVAFAKNVKGTQEALARVQMMQRAQQDQMMAAQIAGAGPGIIRGH